MQEMEFIYFVYVGKNMHLFINSMQYASWKKNAIVYIREDVNPQMFDRYMIG